MFLGSFATFPSLSVHRPTADQQHSNLLGFTQLYLPHHARLGTWALMCVLEFPYVDVRIGVFGWLFRACQSFYRGLRATLKPLGFTQLCLPHLAPLGTWALICILGVPTCMCVSQCFCDFPRSRKHRRASTQILRLTADGPWDSRIELGNTKPTMGNARLYIKAQVPKATQRKMQMWVNPTGSSLAGRR